MPAGHVLVAMLVAFGVATFVNAGALLETAEGLPLDSTKRAIAVGIMRPIHAIADTLGFTWPRERLDVALGHEVVESDDPFAVPTTDPPARSGGRGGNPRRTTTTESGNPKPPRTTTTLPAQREPTRADPLRFFIAGDSLSAEYGKALILRAEETEVMREVAPVDFVIATGLARPDKFNWPAEIAAKSEELDPEVVVLMFGSNDDQSIEAPDGHVYSFGTENWVKEYRRRVGAVMDQIITAGRVVVYVGIPIINNAERNSRYQLINSIIEEEARERAEALYVDSYSLFQDDQGNYAEYLPGGDGQLVQVRTPDGIHFQRAGGLRLADRTLAVLGKLFDLEAGPARERGEARG